jgi:hypothetical protein
MDVFAAALADAIKVWEQALISLSWLHGVVVAVYLGAAWLCYINGFIAQKSGEPTAPWSVAVTILLGLGVNTVLRADVFMTELVRETAKLEQWYGTRSGMQYMAFIGLMVLMFWLLIKLKGAFVAGEEVEETIPTGLLLLIILLGIRSISWHTTDTFINERVLGVSLGRWAELFFLGLVIQGARRCLQRR